VTQENKNKNNKLQTTNYKLQQQQKSNHHS